MAQYTIDYRRVEAVMANMDGVDRRIREMLNRLEVDTQRNLAEWTSEAKDAYRTCKVRWDASAEKMPVPVLMAH